MSDLPKRILEYCVGRTTMIPWPHRILHEAAEAIEAFEADTRLNTAMKLLRDNQSPMRFDREMSQADHDILREARKWR